MSIVDTNYVEPGRSFMEAKINILTSRRTQISLLLTAISTLLWSHSILYSRFEIGHFGLISGLPATFFIGLAFLTAASAILWNDKENHTKLLCLQLLIFISALWLIPLVTSGSPPAFVNSYWYSGCSEYIVRTGHLLPSKIVFHNWPSLFIITSWLLQIGGVKELSQFTLSICPFIIELLLMIPLYLFLKNLVGKQSNYLWAGLWLFCLANWFGEGYGGRSLGFFLSLTLLTIVTSKPLWSGSGKPLAYYVTAVIIFGAIATSHSLTSFIIICILFVLSLTKLSKRLSIVTACCALLLVCSMMGPAASYSKPNIMKLYTMSQTQSKTSEPTKTSQPTKTNQTQSESSQVKSKSIFDFEPEQVMETEIFTRSGGSDSHAIVARNRLLLSGIFALFGLAGVILSFWNRRSWKIAVPIMAIVLAPFLLLFIAPIFKTYPGELHSFLYLFSLPSMAFFAIKLLENKIMAVMLCVILVSIIPLHVVAHYGNQDLDYFSPAQSAELDFFDAHTISGYVTGANPSGRKQNIEQYTIINFIKLHWQDDMLSADYKLKKELPHYVGISRYDIEWYEFLSGDTQFLDKTRELLDNSTKYSYIYDNRESQLWIRDRSN
jgi:hypothetical protein